MNKEQLMAEFADIKAREGVKVISDTCVKDGTNVYILAYSPVYEAINTNKDYSVQNYGYHSHSSAYTENLRNIVCRYKKLIAPEIEIDRKNGSGIDSITLLSNYAEVTNDASVFKEINVLPIIVDEKATLRNILKDYKTLFNNLEKAGFTGSKRTGMHFHISEGLCPNMTVTAHYLSTLSKEQILLYFGRKLNYGHDTQTALYTFYASKFAMLNSQLQELKGAGFSRRQIDRMLNALNIAKFKSCRNHTDVLHYTDFNTWEFRACKGTTHYNTFIERLKIVLTIFTKQRVPKGVNDYRSVREMANALALTEEDNL